MKKVIAMLALSLAVSITAYGDATLGDAIRKLVIDNGITLNDNTSCLDKLQNRRFIKDKKIISAAHRNGFLLINNKILDVDGTDMSPLINGIIKKCVADDKYLIVTGNMETILDEYGAYTDNKTFFITKSLSKNDMSENELYTCVIKGDKHIDYLWNASEIKQPSVYRARLYWAEGNEIIVSKLEKKSYDSWHEVNKGVSVLDADDGIIKEDFVINHLDKTIYMLADDYAGIRIKGIGGN